MWAGVGVALAADPELLLLDEPLSAMDVDLVRVRSTADVTPGSVADLDLRPGAVVWLVVKATVQPTAANAPVERPGRSVTTR